MVAGPLERGSTVDFSLGVSVFLALLYVFPLPGQDATNVLLNYLLEKKAEFKSTQVDRSKAVKLGQQLMNNGFYKPGFDLHLY